jgi:hypothetical protein
MTFRVPQKTSVNDEEFKPDAYVVAFAPELIDFILQDKKLTTYRFGDKYDYLQVGDRVKIQNSQTKELPANAVIVRKVATTFEGLPVALGTHETYSDKEHQRQVLSGYYAYLGRPLEDDDPFLVFDFKLLDN